MKPLEQLLIKLDDRPLSAVWRVVLGFIIPPVFHVLAGSHDLIAVYLLLFMGLLAALRVVPAVFRYTVPFSAETKEIWRRRRFIAKESDAYQWQKLFWIGVGLLAYGIVVEVPGYGELALTALCLIGGGAGIFFWARRRSSINV